MELDGTQKIYLVTAILPCLNHWKWKLKRVGRGEIKQCQCSSGPIFGRNYLKIGGSDDSVHNWYTNFSSNYDCYDIPSATGSTYFLTDSSNGEDFTVAELEVFKV